MPYPSQGQNLREVRIGNAFTQEVRKQVTYVPKTCCKE